MSRNAYRAKFTQSAVGLALLIGTIPVLGAIGAQAQSMDKMNNMQGMGKDKMGNTPGMAKKEQQTTASGVGTVAALNAANHKITLDHEPIAAINWPAMKMEFSAASSVDLSKVKVGDKVRFTLAGSGGNYTVQSISSGQ